MEKLTLEHFKQVIAEKYGYKDWSELITQTTSMFEVWSDDYYNEASELYAQHCAEIAKEEQHNIAREYFENRINELSNLKEKTFPWLTNYSVYHGQIQELEKALKFWEENENKND